MDKNVSIQSLTNFHCCVIDLPPSYFSRRILFVRLSLHSLEMYPLESLLRFRLNSGWIVVQWNSTETGTAWTKIETNICYTLSSWQLDTFLDGTVITSTSIQALNINIISSDLLNWTLQRCLRHVTWLIYNK